LFVGQLDVLVCDRLSSSVFGYLKRPSREDLSNLFQNLCKAFGAFVAHSPSPGLSDESVDWGDWYDAFLS
jgi:hypothetical protein